MAGLFLALIAFLAVAFIAGAVAFAALCVGKGETMDGEG